MARYELTEFEWKIIQPLLPEQVARGASCRGPQGAERDLLDFAVWFAVG